MSMIYSVSSTLAVLIILAGAGAAQANASGNNDTTTVKDAASPVTSPSPAQSPKSVPTTSTLSLWPKRAVGVLAGVVVGIPVCAVRQPIHEEKYGVYQTAGAKTTPRKTIPYAVIYAPFALVSGLIEAPFYALNNSLVNYDKPFSKQQFSITDRQEPLNVDPIKGTSSR